MSNIDQYVALLIGIDSYNDQPLSSCHADVSALAEMLSTADQQYSIRTLRDTEATRQGVLDALATLRQELPSFSLVYFSGHGCHNEVDSYLCTYDGRPHDEGISLSELTRHLPRSHDQGGSWLLILDCCHAAGARLWPTAKPGLLRRDIDASLSGLGTSRAVLAACEADDKAIGASDNSCSFFTSILVDALRGLAADASGNVTLSSVWDYVVGQTQNLNGPQPVLQGDLHGSVVLVSGRAPRGTNPLPNMELQSICDEGERYINAYRSRRASLGSRWKDEGWEDSCRQLEPIYIWMKKQSDRHNEIRNLARYRALERDYIRELSYLSKLAQGTVTRFGTIMAHLGAGGFGTVWETEDEHGERRAYKVYHADQLHDTEKLSRFRRGYHAMRKLSHPNCVAVHTITEVPLGIVMDLIDGSSLRELGAARDPNSLLEFLDDIAAALEHAHSLKVVHRDLKPENVVAFYHNERYVPVLTDFDLAWFPTATQLTVAGIGQAFYAAPEQIQRPGSTAARNKLVDIYSFGQLAYFAATGSDPIPLSQSNATSLEQTLRDEWPPIAANTFIAMYERLTSPDPDKRYQDITAARQAIRSIKRSLTVTNDCPQVFEFQEFVSRCASRIRATDFQMKSPKRALMVSRTGTVSIEVEYRKANDEHTLSCRFDTAILGPKYASRAKRVGENIRRVQAMLAASGDGQRLTSRAGFHSVSVLLVIGGLNAETLEKFVSILRKIVSAGERI